jgi:hypothetical protein
MDFSEQITWAGAIMPRGDALLWCVYSSTKHINLRSGGYAVALACRVFYQKEHCGVA